MTKLRPTIVDVEYVTLADLEVGDITVNFTAIGKDIDIPPTQRQLNAARTRYQLIHHVRQTETERGVEILEFNEDRYNCGVPRCGTWRITRRWLEAYPTWQVPASTH